MNKDIENKILICAACGSRIYDGNIWYADVKTGETFCYEGCALGYQFNSYSNINNRHLREYGVVVNNEYD